MAADSDQGGGDGAGPWPRWATWLLAGSLVFGAVARWAWVGDMEWGTDQTWLSARSQAVVRGEAPWPWIGMGSSVALPNYGPSIWVFIGLATFAPSPRAMCRAVMVMNILSLFGFAWLARARVAPAEREPWLWGLALAAVNPGAVRYARMIWQQSVTPPLTFLVVLAHVHRRSRWGAFLWGLVGALIGQVHMSGFFLVGALLIWTVVAERRDPGAGRTQWWWWLAGSVVGGLSMIPWFWAILHPAVPRVPGGGRGSLVWLLRPRFWAVWFARAVGADILFANGQFDVLHPLRVARPPLLGEPIVDGRPTWIFGALIAALLGVGLFAVGRWAVARANRPRPDAARYPSAVFYVGAFGLGGGLLMTLVVPWVHEHYLVSFFPFPSIWLALMLLPNRRLLASVVVAQALVTGLFLGAVHREGGVPSTPEGLGYERQLARGVDLPR